ncbi:uncharacterized protein LOC116601899 isoform X2 [Nematostella vectensis]|uniref:uncharacterized protein LOC116601899 isoform X2 n=1 Tax=Nematostella vectensis TaxID=45351 RepID=UPI002077841B|nr:uncharacterized protein LOC116601899 isoform X2 [Nematostella vectensis]
MRRAAKKAIINAKDSHNLLGLLIFDEKLVYEQFRKLIDARAAASLSLLKWAKDEDNQALREVFGKVFEVSSIWTTSIKKFSDEYWKYRVRFKEILREERDVDDLRKKEINYATRLNKLQKQLDQTKRRSGDLSKSKPLLEEMTEILTKAEEAHAELEVKVTKHEIYKARKLREGLHAVSESIQTLAEHTLAVSGTYRKLAELIPDTPTQLSEDKMFAGRGISRQLVSELANDLNIKPGSGFIIPSSEDDLEKTYLYAVSRVKEGSASPTTPISPVSPKDRSPPIPLPRKKGRKISAENLTSQNFARPISMDELRPPPSCPPPPVPPQKPRRRDKNDRPSPPTRRHVAALETQHFGRPHSLNDLSVSPCKARQNSPKEMGSKSSGKIWYARSGPIEESDSEDSDGYTEPRTPPFNRRPLPVVPRSPIARVANNDQVSDERPRDDSVQRQVSERASEGGYDNSDNPYQSLHRAEGNVPDGKTAPEYLELLNDSMQC